MRTFPSLLHRLFVEHLESRDLLTFTNPIPVTGIPDNLFATDSPSLIPGDFNGDGLLDMLVGGWRGDASKRVMALSGDGAGDFIEFAAFGLDNTPGAFVEVNQLNATDFNGDGKADPVVAFRVDTNTTNEFQKVAVYLSQSNGGFVPTVALDLPYDSKGDALPSGGNLTRFARFPFVDVADVTGDGKPDLTIITSHETYDFNDPDRPRAYDDRLRVLVGNGAGGFSAKPVVTLPQDSDGFSPYRDVQFTRFRSNLVPDLFLNRASGGGPKVARNRGDGTFQSFASVTGLTTADAVADFTGDGKDDLFRSYTDTDGQQVYDVFAATGSGFVASGKPIPSTSIGNSPFMVADFNGDDRPDLLSSRFESGKQGFRVLIGQGAEGFTPDPAFYPIFSDSVNVNSSVVADLNGDGRGDVLSAGTDSGANVAAMLLSQFKLPAGYVSEQEPNGQLHQASPITFASDPATGKLSATVFRANLSDKDDADFYSFDLSGPTKLEINVRAKNPSLPANRIVNPTISLLRPGGRIHAIVGDGGTGSPGAAGLTIDAPTAGKWTLFITSEQSGVGADLGEYIVTINGTILPPPNLENNFIRVEAVGGDFQYNYANSRYEFQGPVNIGHAPLPGQPFRPFATVTPDIISGPVWYRSDLVHVEGTVAVATGMGSMAPLFTGTWEFDALNGTENKLVVSPLSVQGAFELAGLPVAGIQSLAIKKAGLHVGMRLSMPTELGGWELPLINRAAVVIGPDGPNKFGGTVGLPSLTFPLFGLNIGVDRLAVTYDEDKDEIRLNGRVRFPDIAGPGVGGISGYFADLGNAKDGIILSPSGVDFAGTIGFNSLPLSPDGQWGLSNVSLSLDTVNKTWGGNAGLRFPSPITPGTTSVVSVAFKLDHGRIDSVGVLAGSLNIPLFPPYLYFDYIGGNLINIVSGDPTYQGFAGLSIGPQIDFTLPAYFGGGNFTARAATFDGAVTIDSEHIEGLASVTLLKGLMNIPSGQTINFDLNWRLGTAKIRVAPLTLKIPGSDFQFVFDGTLQFDVRGNISAVGTSLAELPPIKIAEFKTQAITLRGGTAKIEFSNDGNLGNDYFESYAFVQLPVIGSYRLGFRTYFNGSFKFYGWQDPVSNTFEIAPNTAAFLIGTQWETDTGTAPAIELIDPDGTVFTEADFDNVNIGLIPEFSSATYKSVGLKNPKAGTWTIRVPDETGLGAVSFHGFFDTPPPVVSIDAIEAVGNDIRIRYTATGPANPARLALYYTTEDTDLLGTAIVTDLPANGAGEYLWTPTNIPPGSYRIFARADDDLHFPVYVDAPTRATVIDLAPVFTPVSSPLTALEDTEFELDMVADDPNGMRVVYSLEPGAPANSFLDPHTGAFRWIPTEAEGGSMVVLTIRAADAFNPASFSLLPVTIEVQEANTAPQFDLIPDFSTLEHAPFEFTLTATDSDAPTHKLRFSLVDGPIGFAVDTATGKMTWTPTESDGGKSVDVTVRVTDNGLSPLSETATFSIFVAESNDFDPVLPVLGPFPLNAGKMLSVSVAATDLDGPANLRYRLVGPPGQGNLDSVTGRFTWTPAVTTFTEAYEFTVWAEDSGSSYRDAATSFVVNVAGVPPTVPPVSPPPVSPPISPPPISPPPVSPPISPPPVSPPPVSPPRVNPPSTVLIGSPQFAVGTDMGIPAIVRVFNPNGSERFQFKAFSDSFTGGVRTVVADFTGDSVADVVVGTGPGAATIVRVIDGVTQQELFTLNPFEAAFTGGVYVSAGDVTGDGRPELIITPDEGGGPRVRIYDGNGFTEVADFFGIDDPNFRGGARAAFGDVNGDGVADLVVSAGFLGGPRIAVFNGKSLGFGKTPERLVNDFFAFEETLRNGAFVAVGDVNGDGFADLIFGGGPGGGPRLRIADAKQLLNAAPFGTLDNFPAAQIANFFAGDPENREGVRVSVKNLDNDNQADVVTGVRAGDGSQVIGYSGKVLTSGTPTPQPDLLLDAFPDTNAGVFVG